jgi:predicted porin
MNKKLVALAVAGACALPLTAQAQTANVTLYGRLNLDSEVIINQKQDTSTSASQIKGNYYRVSSNSSRLGVRGDENLGGGLHAIFQVEQRFDASNAGNVSTAGDTYAGLQGGWGTLKIGYFLTPYDDISPIHGSVPTLITGILGTSAVWSNTGYIGNSIDTGAFDDRSGNSLEYTTPNLKGFTGNFLVAGRDTGGNDGGTLSQQRRHASVYSLSGVYANGPFTAGIAYEAHNKLRDGLPATAACPSCQVSLQDQGVTAAISYQWGAVKIAAVYEGLSYDIATGGDLKRNMWGASATANWGPGQFYTAYYHGANGRGSAQCLDAAGKFVSCGSATQASAPRVGAVTEGPSTSVNMYEFSYTYPLSKRTLLYAGYVMIDNAKNGGYNFHVNQINGICTGNNAASNLGTGSGCGAAARPQGVALGIVEFW